MCLTMPRKVISVSGRAVVLENLDGTRQDYRTVIDLAVGDFVLTQGGIAVEKIADEHVQEFLDIINGGGINERT